MSRLPVILGLCIMVQVILASNPECEQICPKEYPITDNLHLRYPSDCTKFCHCANDGKWLKDCPIANMVTGERLHFNAQKQVCDWKWRANCTETSDVCDSVCPDVWPIQENNHIAYPGDVTKFCHCANDGNWAKDCPIADLETGEKLHFNPELQVCVWPEA